MDEVARLHAMLLASKGIIKLILKRKAFIQKMMEFEVIASDPRRLFKSSVVLNREEEFRKTAYPTLLDLETKIRAELEAFEEKTGEPFMWEVSLLFLFFFLSFFLRVCVCVCVCVCV